MENLINLIQNKYYGQTLSDIYQAAIDFWRNKAKPWHGQWIRTVIEREGSFGGGLLQTSVLRVEHAGGEILFKTLSSVQLSLGISYQDTLWALEINAPTRRVVWFFRTAEQRDAPIDFSGICCVFATSES